MRVEGVPPGCVVVHVGNLMQSRVVAMLAQDVRHQAQADQLAARIGYSQREYAAAHAAGLAGSTAPGTANHSHILPAWRRDDNGGGAAGGQARLPGTAKRGARRKAADPRIPPPKLLDGD